jgi:hypothetical protein
VKFNSSPVFFCGIYFCSTMHNIHTTNVWRKS